MNRPNPSKRALEIVVGLVVGVAISMFLMPVLGHQVIDVPSPPVAVADNGGALERVVLQYNLDAAERLETTYSQLLAAMSSQIEVFVAVESADHFEDLVQRLADRGIHRPLSMIEVGLPITNWSRDRYTLTQSESGSYLVVPEASDGANQLRINDWMVPFSIAEHLSDVEVITMPLRFDGGDLLVLPNVVLASHRMLQKNLRRRVDSREELISIMEETFNRPVFIFGETASDVPFHHLGMYLTPLADGRMVVGDPDLAVELLGEERALAMGADLLPSHLARFRTVAGFLEDAGFEILRLPLLPLEGERNYITYNNLLMEQRDGETYAYVPTFGIPELDEWALARYAEWGVHATGIDVQDIFMYNGSVRCLVNVISRRSS